MLGDQTGLGASESILGCKATMRPFINWMQRLILWKAAGEAAMDQPVSYDLSIASV